MLANEALINEAVISARPIEGELRKIIVSDLARAYGPEWRSRVPESLLDKWSKLREAEMEASRDRGPELLEYATLAELYVVLNKDWDVFSQRFGEGQWRADLEEFRIIRNRLIHSSSVAAEDCERIMELAGRIKLRCDAQVKVIRKELDEAQIRHGPATEIRLSKERKRFYEMVVAETAGMSGKLATERQVLVDFLVANKRFLSFSLVEAVRTHFSALEETEEAVNRLSNLVPPRRPTMPDTDWNLSDWLKWAGRSYLPYRRWMIRVNEEDDEIEKLGLSFESWLHTNYPQVLIDGSPQLVANVYQEIQKVIDSNYGVLWLVIDNLADYWLPMFHETLAAAGFTLKRNQRMLAMLPSVTEISRRAMFAGRLPRDAVEAYPDDSAAFNALWSPETAYKPRFCRTLREAQSAVAEGSQLVTIVHNRLDQRSHRQEDGWFSMEEDIEHELRRMFDRIARLIQDMNRLRPTKLVVSTDHGCLKPSATSVVSELPVSATPAGDFDNHRRYAVIDDATGINAIDWHVLDSESFHLPKDYAVARGQRFVGGRPRGYAHGGLSPEETVVQFFVAEPGMREDDQLSFFFAGPPVRLGQESGISILVKNPFPFDVEQVRMQMQHMDLSFAPFDLAQFTEGTTNMLTFTLPKDADIQDGKAILPVMCEYMIGGKQASITSEIKVDVLTLYESEIDDFEGLFDE